MREFNRQSDWSIATWTSSAEPISVKVGGLRNLVNCCRRTFGKIVSAHVLTSAYSIFGNDGQHDYGAANETLDRLCGLREIQGRDRKSVAWQAWDGVGMTQGSEFRILAKQRELAGLRTQDGQELFREFLPGRRNLRSTCRFQTRNI